MLKCLSRKEMPLTVRVTDAALSLIPLVANLRKNGGPFSRVEMTYTPDMGGWLAEGGLPTNGEPENGDQFQILYRPNDLFTGSLVLKNTGNQNPARRYQSKRDFNINPEGMKHALFQFYIPSGNPTVDDLVEIEIEIEPLPAYKPELQDPRN